MSQSSANDPRKQPRARYIPPQARNLRDQQVFLYDRTGGGFGGGEVVTDPDTIETIKDAIDLALHHIFSPRSMVLLNQALQQQVSEFGEWVDHGPRLVPGSTDVPLSRVLADQLQRRSVNDRLQLVVDRTLTEQNADGMVDGRQPFQIRINSDIIDSVVQFRRTNHPCATASLVFLASVICHESIHAIRRTTDGCAFDTPPQIRSAFTRPCFRGLKHSVEQVREDGMSEWVEVETGEGGWWWEEGYWGGAIRTMLVPADDSGEKHRPIDSLCVVKPTDDGKLEYIEISEDVIEAINRASDEDLEILPIEHVRGQRRWAETCLHMARSFQPVEGTGVSPHQINEALVAPRGCIKTGSLDQ